MYELERRSGTEATGAEREDPAAVTDTAQRRPASEGPGGLAAPRALHYAASPLTRGGISLAENEAVRSLSGARVDLHAIGATVRAVPAADPRLREVGARSLTKGRHALVGDPADRGHEIWHLAQQAMGQVRPTEHIAGKPVNASPSLEAEADRMGAAIARETAGSAVLPIGCQPGGGVPAAISDSPPIQRQVTKFSAVTSDRIPPAADLINSLDYDKFNDDEDDVVDKIQDATRNPKKTVTKTPTKIKASIAPNTFGHKALARATYKSGVVGKIGTDDYFLSSGVKEVFEGGHLIPHELWSDKDKQRSLADDYVNLVPMSRTMNVGDNSHTWRTQEKAMLEHYEQGNSFSVTVDIDSPVAREFTYERIGEVFGVSVAAGEEDSIVQVYNWLPKSVTLTGDKSTNFDEQAYENEIYNVHDPITDGAALVAALKQTAIWSRCDENLQNELEKL
jgi:hypothetical protein